MAVSIDDYDDLSTFVYRLLQQAGQPGKTATDRFRGVEVRCVGCLGGRKWSVTGIGLGEDLAFYADIGWDEEDYVTDRLIRSGLFPIEQY